MTGVGFVTTDGPRWGDCGEFHWKVRFYITDSQGEAVQPKALGTISWVVQHVKFDEHFDPCPGDPPPAVSPSPDEYYELFCIGPDAWAQDQYDYGSDHVTGAEEDELANDALSGVIGTFSFLAEAFWVPARPQGMTQRKLPGMMGGLEQSPTKPRGIGNPSLTRKVKGSWQCCAHDTYTVSGEATAENAWNRAGHISYKETWTCKQAGEIAEHTKTVEE